MVPVPVIHETADEEVELAVVIVVEPDGARRPARRSKARLHRYIAERPVSVVLIKDAVAVGGDEEIRIPVVIEVANCNTHTESPAGDTRFFGNVGERAIPVVVIERVPQPLLGMKEVARSAVDQIDIHP